MRTNFIAHKLVFPYLLGTSCLSLWVDCLFSGGISSVLQDLTIPHLWLARKPLVPHQKFLLSLLFFLTTCPILSRSHRLCLSASNLLLIALMFTSLRRCYWIIFFPLFFSENVLNPWLRLLLVHLDEYIACFPSETYAC